MWMLGCSTNQTRMTPSVISQQVGEIFFDSGNKLPYSLCSQGDKLLITFDGCSSIQVNMCQRPPNSVRSFSFAIAT